MRLLKTARETIIPLAIWMLGVVFIAAASLKAIDLSRFSNQIARYDLIPPDLVATLAVSIIVIEAILGICCIADIHSRKALWAMMALLLIFIAVTLIRWSSLSGSDCNCFGALFGGGPESVLWHNALLILVIGILLAVSRADMSGHHFRWLRAVSAIIAVTFLMFFGQPLSANSSLLRDAKEDHIRVFLSSTCKHCQESTGKVRELMEAADLPPVRVFIAAQYEQQIKEFIANGNFDVEYVPLTMSQLADEVDKVPTTQILRAGKVDRQWAPDVPSLVEVRQALSAHSKAAE